MIARMENIVPHMYFLALDVDGRSGGLESVFSNNFQLDNSYACSYVLGIEIYSQELNKNS